MYERFKMDLERFEIMYYRNADIKEIYQPRKVKVMTVDVGGGFYFLPLDPVMIKWEILRHNK